MKKFTPQKIKNIYLLRDLAIKVGKIGFTFNSNIRGNSILVGNDSIGFPLYWDKETLQGTIKNIEQTYAEEDNYFIKRTV